MTKEELLDSWVAKRQREYADSIAKEQARCRGPVRTRWMWLVFSGPDIPTREIAIEALIPRRGQVVRGRGGRLEAAVMVDYVNQIVGLAPVDRNQWDRTVSFDEFAALWDQTAAAAGTSAAAAPP